MRRNLDLTRGQTLAFSGTLRDGDGDAIDLTSATLTWKMARQGCDDAALSLSEADGISVASGTGGGWTVTLAPSHTSSLTPGWYRHQGEAAIGSAVYPFTDGYVNLRGDIS